MTTKKNCQAPNISPLQKFWQRRLPRNFWKPSKKSRTPRSPTSQCSLCSLRENQRSNRLLPQSDSHPQGSIAISDFKADDAMRPSHARRRNHSPVLTFKKITKPIKASPSEETSPIKQEEEKPSLGLANQKMNATEEKNHKHLARERPVSSPIKSPSNSQSQSSHMTRSPVSPLGVSPRTKRFDPHHDAGKAKDKTALQRVTPPLFREAAGMPVKLKVKRAELRSIKANIAESRDSFLRHLNSQCVAQIDRVLTDH